MKTYFADTNLYLRFILADDQTQFKKVNNFFRRAQRKKLKIVFLAVVILEMEFVLRNVYSFSKTELIKSLLTLVKSEYLEIEERELWFEAFRIFQEKNLSLFDIFLFLKAQKSGAEVLSFDQDFKKLKRRLK